MYYSIILRYVVHYECATLSRAVYVLFYSLRRFLQKKFIANSCRSFINIYIWTQLYKFINKANNTCTPMTQTRSQYFSNK